MVSFLNINYERCVLQGVSLPLGQTGKYLVDFFKNKYGINIKYLEQTKTSPIKGPNRGRIDQIFNVEEDSLEKFAEIKDEIGARYVKDIVRNNEHHAYIERVFVSYFQRAQDELIKDGELSEENAYKMLGK